MAENKLTSKNIPKKDDYINNSFTIEDTPNNKQVKCHERVAISLTNTLVMSNAQKHIFQRWLAEKKNIVPKFSSLNSVSTPSYFQKVSSLDSNVMVIDDRQFIPTQANDIDFSIKSKYFDNKSQISGDNQLDDQAIDVHEEAND